METKRFIIRKYTLDDAEKIYKNYATNPNVTKYLTWEPHKDIEETKKFIGWVISTNQRNFLIIDKNTLEAVGSIGVVAESSDYKGCEVGYCISEQYWNQGAMTECLSRFLDYLFVESKYEVVTCKHHRNNIASGIVMIKCGFKKQFIEEVNVPKFGWTKLVNYSMNRKEYEMIVLQRKLEEKFDINVPCFDNKEAFFDYLNGKNFQVEKINFIYDDFIDIKKHDDVFFDYDIVDNIVTYYFAAKIENKNSLFSYLSEQVDRNFKFFISNIGMKVEKMLYNMLNENHLSISFAESCTGGEMVSTLVSVPGASNVLSQSFVTYSEKAKIDLLRVKEETLEKYTVYSKEVAFEMASGLFNRTGSNVCISITGLAGGNVPTQNDGSYDYCIIVTIKGKEKKIVCEHKRESGLRNEVRNKQVNYVFFRTIRLLEDILYK